MSIDEFIRFVKRSNLHNSFYHFTDKRNLPLIRKHGLLSTRSRIAAGIEVPAPGGNEWSMEADARSGMDAYVHLCLKTRNAMEYSAKKEGRVQDVVYLVIDPEIIKLPGVLMTTDVANKAGVVAEPAAKMIDKLDREVLYTRTKWSEQPFKDRIKAADKSEVLVPDHVPLRFIRNING